jgi:hypothetical protein
VLAFRGQARQIHFLIFEKFEARYSLNSFFRRGQRWPAEAEDGGE